MSSASSSADFRALATHLVVFQHGLWGNEKDFRSFQALFQQYFPQDEVFAYVATANATSLTSLFQTYDGMDVGGTRLADEIELVAKGMPRLSKFSILGHSLGGLYARYCVGVLFARGFFENVEPMNFVTLATPHMGIRRSQPTPMNAMFNALAPNFFDLTGQQFTLKDTASEQAIALSHSVRRYPHRRSNVSYDEIDDMLLVRLPHADVHPATTTRAEAQSFEVVECILREGVLRLYRKSLVPVETQAEDEAEDDDATSPPGTDEEAGSLDDESDQHDHDAKTRVEVTCLAEMDLADAQVTIVLPEKGGRRRRRRRHSLRRRASEMSTNEDGSFWDIEIAVDRPASTDTESPKETLTKIKYTIRVPYDELVSKWKWIVALSNASHGVHCRSQTSPSTVKDALVNSSAPTVLSCLTRGQFIQGLQLFRNRTLYSSIFNDMQVPYSCGAIRAFNPYRTELDPSEAARSPHYMHVVARSIWNAPLLRDTLPEDVKNREDRASSVDRFSLVKMLSERTTSRRRYSSAVRAPPSQQSLSMFFTNLTSSNSSTSAHHTRPTRGNSDLPPLAPALSSSSLSVASSVSSSSGAAIHHRLDAIPPAAPNSLPVTAETGDNTDSESSSSSELAAQDGKRMPPFEDGALLLDHPDQAFSNDELRDSLRGMMVSLQSVGWRRIDVHFHSPLAHMKIIAMTANPTKPLTKGLDIVHHVMDTFLL